MSAVLSNVSVPLHLSYMPALQGWSFHSCSSLIRVQKICVRHKKMDDFSSHDAIAYCMSAQRRVTLEAQDKMLQWSDLQRQSEIWGESGCAHDSFYNSESKLTVISACSRRRQEADRQLQLSYSKVASHSNPKQTENYLSFLAHTHTHPDVSFF